MKVIENVPQKIREVLEDWDVEFGDNIVNDICKAAGIPDTLVTGKLDQDKQRVYPGSTVNGVCYKDKRAFNEDVDAICYIPEGGIDDSNYFDEQYAYSRGKLYSLVAEHILRHGLSNSGHQLVEELFDELDWQFPETIIDQWSESLKNE